MERRDRISHQHNIYQIMKDYLRWDGVRDAVYRSGYRNSISRQIPKKSKGDYGESGVGVKWEGRKESAGRVRCQRLTLLTHNSPANNLTLSLSLCRICSRHSLAPAGLACHSCTPILPLPYTAAMKNNKKRNIFRLSSSSDFWICKSL